MNINDATEYAYKKGYKSGVKDVLDEIEKTVKTCIETEYLKGSWFNMGKFEQRLAELKQKYTEEKP